MNPFNEYKKVVRHYKLSKKKQLGKTWKTKENISSKTSKCKVHVLYNWTTMLAQGSKNLMENYLAYVIRRVWKHLPLIVRWYRWMQWKKPFRWMSSKLTRSSKSILKHIYFSNSLSYRKCEIKSIKINWHATNSRICRSQYNALQVKRLVWPPQDRFHQCSIPGPPVDHNQ